MILRNGWIRSLTLTDSWRGDRESKHYKIELVGEIMTKDIPTLHDIFRKREHCLVTETTDDFSRATVTVEFPPEPTPDPGRLL